MYKYLLLGTLLLSISKLKAQEVIGTLGGTYTNSTVEMSFTVGEMIISTENSGAVDLTQGFHQPELALSGIDNLSDPLMISVYPNPTADYINVSFDDFEGTLYNVRSIDGKLLIAGSMTSSQTQIDLSLYERGVYTVEFLNGNKNLRLKTYQIIKQ